MLYLYYSHQIWILITQSTKLGPKKVLQLEMDTLLFQSMREIFLEIGGLSTGFGILLVAICWGLTNPFLKNATKGIEKVKHPDSILKRLYYEFLFLAKLEFVIPFLINLAGSSVFYYTLSHIPLTLAIPLTNSLSMLFTVLGGLFFGEQITKRQLLGGFITLVGVLLMSTH